MDTMNSIHATEHRRDLREHAARAHAAPRTQVRRWVQLKHLYGGREERWGARSRSAVPTSDPACATC
jgi:hypothetical protein